ncbi:Cell division protein FtsL [Xenorhabdus nematophila F1]|uniref:Cell division protein FtsL n=2 Tax=Xenorhabdus nematophila TaxID=628 RepID=D3V8S3_XENNA|nr:cell division protein; ingrowth of wall at septum [Xenorhabdus nematophila ATCC 19061]CCW31421.1 Cell division protein FtsL [Xenorhabdus nematophila F1]CEE93633.1 cell division protein; ingrowth of wall at septum [Xenorhabdus nematophila str. Anatoliense]CEF30861.1 cell division protein; ingrowth of wall at septum [Xenorhabdus nematophila str. Websteri]CEK22029.1 cell division protein; ingrowth of wall at septum [Xenorhabdus nematophila AN6/1]
MAGERHGLVGVIGKDLIRNAKLPLILLVSVVISAISVVTVAHKTRLLTAEKERQVIQLDAQDIEWRNLLLEENALGDHSRVERIATQNLQMQHVDPAKEKIVITH